VDLRGKTKFKQKESKKKFYLSFEQVANPGYYFLSGKKSIPIPVVNDNKSKVFRYLCLVNKRHLR